MLLWQQQSRINDLHVFFFSGMAGANIWRFGDQQGTVECNTTNTTIMFPVHIYVYVFVCVRLFCVVFVCWPFSPVFPSCFFVPWVCLSDCNAYLFMCLLAFMRASFCALHLCCGFCFCSLILFIRALSLCSQLTV